MYRLKGSVDWNKSIGYKHNGGIGGRQCKCGGYLEMVNKNMYECPDCGHIQHIKNKK